MKSGRGKLLTFSAIQHVLLGLCFFGYCACGSAQNASSEEVKVTAVNHAGYRHLLQTKKSCPVNFEFQNYSIITGKCKGPLYPKNICCSALKAFACPFAAELNDGTNDCASTMFSYINLHGKYPPGLFANECTEGSLGLDCGVLAPGSSVEGINSTNSNGSNASQMVWSFSAALWLAGINLLGLSQLL